MNHLLSNIINTTRSRRVESNHSRFNNRRGRNIFVNAMSLNNRHNRRQSSLPIDNENTTMMSLSGVKRFPMRVKCATLAWHTFMHAAEGKKDTANTEK